MVQIASRLEWCPMLALWRRMEIRQNAKSWECSAHCHGEWDRMLLQLYWYASSVTIFDTYIICLQQAVTAAAAQLQQYNWCSYGLGRRLTWCPKCRQSCGEGWRSRRVRVVRYGSSHGEIRVTIALIRIFWNLSGTHNDCWCTAAAVVPRTLRDRRLPTTHANSNGKNICFPFIFSHETSPLEKRIFLHTKPRNISRGPSEGPPSIQTAFLVAMKRVLTLQPTGQTFSYAAGFSGACITASTVSFELAALVGLRENSSRS